MYKNMDYTIELQNVTKAYNKHLAVEDLSLRVEAGEIFGFLGPNGAGKTTTIRLLLGLLHPDAGEVRLFGKDINNERSAVAVKSLIGFLPDIGQMDKGFSGGEWLQFLGQLQTSTDFVLQSLLLDRLQLSRADLKRGVGTYSRGMRQKLAIVQALQHRPRLLILDEPTEGLDPLAKHTLFEILKDVRQQGVTVFFSSHVLSEVERLCDRVALIRAGKLVALDSVNALRDQLARRVELILEDFGELDQSQFQKELAKVSGLPDQPIKAEVTSRGLSLNFELQKDPSQLLDFITVSKLKIIDLIIEPANLEDVFLQYYQN